MNQLSPKQLRMPEKTWPLLKRIIRTYIRPYMGEIAFAFLFMLLAAGMTAVQAQLMEPIIDGVLKQGNRTLLFEICGGILVAFTLRGAGLYVQNVVMNDVGQKIVSDIQRQLYRHLIQADLSFFHEHASGGLISYMTNDVNVMRMALAESVTGFAYSLLTLLALIGLMFYQDWKLAIASFIVFPLAAVGVSRLGKSMRTNSGETQAELSIFSGLLQQSFQGARQVKAYNMENYEIARVNHVIQRLFQFSVKGFRLGAVMVPMTEVLSGFAICAVLLYGGYQVMQGHNTPGALFSFITAFILAYDPMKRLAKINQQAQMGLAAAERVFEMLDRPVGITDKPDAKPFNKADTSVAFEQVRFYYPDGTLALDGLNLRAEAGRMIAIVGPSGAGKSTILNLILRFYDVAGGHVLLGGQDVQDTQLRSLRDHVALVSQEVMLFDDTVKVNIGYGREGADDAAIQAAAEAAFAHEFIMQLPQGYNTKVGENGVKLSGGQRQRIVIARAMLRNAPILLLDEATSALDNASERAVQAALKKLEQGRTTIVVAHRLSTIIDADWIYVMEHGRIVEEGKHDTLLARGGVYARLYESDARADANPQTLNY